VAAYDDQVHEQQVAGRGGGAEPDAAADRQQDLDDLTGRRVPEFGGSGGYTPAVDEGSS
jgi:hypothetical protein